MNKNLTMNICNSTDTLYPFIHADKHQRHLPRIQSDGCVHTACEQTSFLIATSPDAGAGLMHTTNQKVFGFMSDHATIYVT